MIIDIHDLDAGEIAFDFRADPCEVGIGGGDERIAGEIEIRGSVAKGGEGVQLKGVVSFVAELVCSRCLERFERPFQTRLNVRLVPELSRIALPREATLHRDDLDLASYDGHTVEVNPFVRDAVLLALPLRSLCHESCRGLCLRCGQNLNRGICDCSATAVDPRWAKLDDIKRNGKTKE